MKYLLLFLFPVLLSAQTYDETHPDTTRVVTATSFVVEVSVTAEQAATLKRGGVDLESVLNHATSKALERAGARDAVTTDLAIFTKWGIPLDAELIDKLRTEHGIQNKRQYRETIKKTDLP